MNIDQTPKHEYLKLFKIFTNEYKSTYTNDFKIFLELMSKDLLYKELNILDLNKSTVELDKILIKYTNVLGKKSAFLTRVFIKFINELFINDNLELFQKSLNEYLTQLKEVNFNGVSKEDLENFENTHNIIMISKVYQKAFYEVEMEFIKFILESRRK